MIKIAGTFPKLLVLVGLCLFSGGLFAVLGMALVGVLYNIPILELGAVMSDVSKPENVSILKFLQLFNTLGIFIVPAIVYPLLFIKNPIQFIGLKTSLQWKFLLLIPLLYLTYLPIINWVVEFNESLSLPDIFYSIEEWMRNAEDKAKVLTEAFLQMDSISDLLINIFLIGVLPAIGEELIFRGIIQKTINENLKNRHIGIWVAAILFSALHMQFYGFLPRMLLGAFFGYLFLWTRSIWAPIIAHFINNTSAVLISYYYGINSTKIDEIGLEENGWISLLISAIIFSYLLNYFRKGHKKTTSIEVVE